MVLVVDLRQGLGGCVLTPARRLAVRNVELLRSTAEVAANACKSLWQDLPGSSGPSGPAVQPSELWQQAGSFTAAILFGATDLAGMPPRRPTMRALVVEGCPSLADQVAGALSCEGIAADMAHDGAEAADKLCVHSYDVVVLDRNVRDIPGDTLCRMISEADQSVMVLMLGGPSPSERVSGLAVGADDYLSKPFHLPELVLRVRALARRRPGAMPRVLRAGGIELDSLCLSVTRDGKPVELSVKEIAVLEALMAASPTYLSAEQLLGKVWDENADPFTKTVAVTVGRLRRKLGEPPVIDTLPRAGYRIPTGTCQKYLTEQLARRPT